MDECVLTRSPLNPFNPSATVMRCHPSLLRCQALPIADASPAPCLVVSCEEASAGSNLRLYLLALGPWRLSFASIEGPYILQSDSYLMGLAWLLQGNPTDQTAQTQRGDGVRLGAANRVTGEWGAHLGVRCSARFSFNTICEARGEYWPGLGRGNSGSGGWMAPSAGECGGTLEAS